MTLSEYLAEWDLWASSADSSYDGWQSSFPKWRELVIQCQSTMLSPIKSTEALELVERCWQLSEETEDLLTFAKDNICECLPWVIQLARSESATVRWQAADALGAIGEMAKEALNHLAESDDDRYVVRRALMSLARFPIANVEEMIEELSRDADPYLRQVSILFLPYLPQEHASIVLSSLRIDDVDHVRKAAENYRNSRQ